MTDSHEAILVGINVEDSKCLPYDATGRWEKPCSICGEPMWVGERIVGYSTLMNIPIICSRHISPKILAKTRVEHLGGV